MGWYGWRRVPTKLLQFDRRASKVGLHPGDALVDIADLRSVLAEGSYDSRGYRILDAPGEGTWCIRKQGKAWLVFYFERGTKWQLERFKTEGAACEYFLNRIVHG
jgi:hypothetical protein